jgi:hypothetical protein
MALARGRVGSGGLPPTNGACHPADTETQWEQTPPRRRRYVVAVPVLAAIVGAALIGRFAAVESANPDDLEIVVASETPAPSPRPRPSRLPRPSPTPTPTLAPLGTWTELDPEPLGPRFDAKTFWTGTHLLVWGGHHDQWPSRSELTGNGAMWDPSDGSWAEIPPAPIPARRFSAATWTGEQLFVWGGTDVTAHRADGALYDPSNGWTVLPTAPLSPRWGAVAVTAGDEVLVVGGHDNLGSLRDGASYDLSSRQWRRLPRLPRGLSEPFAGMSLAGGQAMVLAHNLLGEPVRSSALVYDADRDRWHPLTPRAEPNSESLSSIAAVGDDLYALTGNSPLQVLALQSGHRDWEPVRDLPEGAWPQQVVGGDRYLFILATNPTLTVQRLDTRTMQWTPLSVDPSPWQEVTGVWTGDELIVRGTVSHAGGGGAEGIAPRLMSWRPASAP